MALQNPWHIANVYGKSVTALPKPKPVVGPQNVGLPGYRPGDVYNPAGVIAAPPVAAPAVAPPPPIDFNALTLTDPQYTQGRNQLETQNALSLEGMLANYKRQAQASQDQANSHGALFSGAAVNAQRSLGQDYANQGRQQALNYGGSLSGLYWDVFNRKLRELGGV